MWASCCQWIGHGLVKKLIHASGELEFWSNASLKWRFLADFRGPGLDSVWTMTLLQNDNSEWCITKGAVCYLLLGVGCLNINTIFNTISHCFLLLIFKVRRMIYKYHPLPIKHVASDSFLSHISLPEAVPQDFTYRNYCLITLPK